MLSIRRRLSPPQPHNQVKLRSSAPDPPPARRHVQRHHAARRLQPLAPLTPLTPQTLTFTLSLSIISVRFVIKACEMLWGIEIHSKSSQCGNFANLPCSINFKTLYPPPKTKPTLFYFYLPDHPPCTLPFANLFKQYNIFSIMWTLKKHYFLSTTIARRKQPFCFIFRSLSLSCLFWRSCFSWSQSLHK